MIDKIVDIEHLRQRAYRWAHREMEEYFPCPDRLVLMDLEKRSEKFTTHVALFKSDNDDDPVIIRVLWSRDATFKYSIVVNYDELVAEHPELVQLLLNNGVYAYENRRLGHQGNTPGQVIHFVGKTS